jgi:hypothetical protein
MNKLQHARVILTAAQVRELAATPQVIVPAPGPGLYITPRFISASVVDVTQPYEVPDQVGLSVQEDGADSIYCFGGGSGDLTELLKASEDSVVVGTTNTGNFDIAAAADVENRPAVLVATAPINTGPVASVEIDDGGAAYEVNDVLDLVQGDGTGAQVTVDAVDGGGAITAATLSAPGTGYAPGIVSTTGGAGAGASFEITAVDNGDGQLVYDAWYTVDKVGA